MNSRHNLVSIQIAISLFLLLAHDGNADRGAWTTNGGGLPFILEWGSPGTGPGEFDYPMGIDLDGAGNVYVADMYNNRIQKFDADGSFQMEWGTEGDGPGQFALPSGVAVDPTGAHI